MASYNKFNNFTMDLLNGCHDFSGDSAAPTYKILLTNNAPSATWHTYANVTGEVSNGNGYVTGGQTVAMTLALQTATVNVAQVTPPSDNTFTATGGSIGPFRYAVLYTTNNSHGINSPLVAWWDYGSAVTLSTGETFTVDFDQVNGIFTMT